MTKYNLSKLINYLAAALAFSLPLSRAGVSLFSILIILFWILDKNFKTNIQAAKRDESIIALGLFFMFFVIALTWTSNIQNGLKYLGQYWYFLVIPALATTLEKKHTSTIISIFLLGMLISELLSYGIFFELIHMKHGTPQDPTPFMKHLDYSIFLAFSSLLLLYKTISSDKVRQKIIYSLFFISMTTNLFITGGRSGQLAFFLTITILLLNAVKRKFIAITLILILPALTAYLAYNYSKTFHTRADKAYTSLDNAINKNKYNTSIGARTGAILITRDIIKKHPIIGIGISDHTKYLRKVLKEKNSPYSSMRRYSWYMHFHNQYLEVVAQFGFVGLALFLYFFVTILTYRYDNPMLNALKVILVFVFLVGFVGEPFFQKQFTMAMFALFLGILLASKKMERQKQLRLTESK